MQSRVLLVWVVLLVGSACLPVDDGGGGSPDGSGAGGTAGDAGTVDSGAPFCVDDGRPTARAEMMGIFDPVRRNIVFYGGDDGAPVQCNPSPHPIDSLWRYDVDCGTFEKLDVSQGPGGRSRGMAIYDSTGDRMVIFGGRYREVVGTYEVSNDLWAVDLETFEFSQIFPTDIVPRRRSTPAGGYDTVNDALVFFGGNDSASGAIFGPLGDSWRFDFKTETWKQIATTGTPPAARLLHAGAVDSVGQRLFIYGGTNSFFGAFFADLWSLDMDTGEWTLLHDGTAGAPIGRIWSTIVHDKLANRLILFGGHDSGSVGNNNDTWAFDLTANTWSNIVPPQTVNESPVGFCDFTIDFTLPNLNAPERRSAQLASLDEQRGEWVIFGGKTDCGIIDDAWTFSLATDGWVKLMDSTVGESCNRTGDCTAAMCPPIAAP